MRYAVIIPIAGAAHVTVEVPDDADADVIQAAAMAAAFGEEEVDWEVYPAEGALFSFEVLP